MPRCSMVSLFVIICLTILVSDLTAITFDRIQVHGFVSQGFMISDRNNYLADTDDGTFEFNEAGINFSQNFSEHFHVSCQFFARDIGDVGNNDIELDFALADYRLRDFIGIRFGKIKIPHGLYNEIRDFDMLRTFIFLPPVYYDISRSTINAMNGIGLYGNYQVPKIGNIEYQLIGGSKSIDPESGWSRYMERRGIDITQFDIGFVGCGQFIWNLPFQGVRLGMTGTRLNMAADAEIEFIPISPEYAIAGPDMAYNLDNFFIHVSFFEYTLNDLILAFEYMTFRGDLSLKTLHPKLPIKGYDVPVRTDTCYLSVSYRLSDYIEIGGFSAIFWPDSNDKSGQNMLPLPDYMGWHKETALCLRLDINESLTFKTEAHLIDGGALMMPQDNPEGIDRRSALFLFKLTFSF